MTTSSLRALIPLAGLQRWPNQERRASNLWLGRHCVVASWLGLLLALLSPPTGSGLLLCWFKDATGLSCPGCGLTRSLSCGIRGMFVESWHYHPMGLVILVLFIFTALQSLFPGSVRGRIHHFLQVRPSLFSTLYIAFVTVFVTFGTVRALLQFRASWMQPN